MASVLGAVYMVLDGYYFRTEEVIREEKIESMAQDTSQDLFYQYFDVYSGEFKFKDTSDFGNFIFRIVDEDGKTYVKSGSSPDSYTYKAYYAAIPPEDQNSGNAYWIHSFQDPDYVGQREKNNADAKIYTMEFSVVSDNSLNDRFTVYSKVHHLLYSLKTGIYVIGVLAFVLLIVSFISLMCVAGRKPGKEEIVPWYFHKLPFDIVTAGYLFFVASVLMLFATISDELGFMAAGCCAVFLPLFCMSIAVRIKTHTLIRNTIIYKVLSFLWRGLKALGRGVVAVLKNMKILYKVIIALVVLMFIWAVVILFDHLTLDAMFYAFTILFVIPFILFVTLQIDKVLKGAKELSEGNFDYVIDTNGMLPGIRKHAENLNSIAGVQKIAVEEKLKSERMKTELITNVSHDIKTPLTSIINYADLISKEETVSEKSKEYSEVLVRQSKRLKTLLEDLVEASKASTGNLEVDLQPCDAQIFVAQSAGEFEEKMKEYDLTLFTSVPDDQIRIMADGRRMQRIFDNLLNNICKYSLPGTRVYVDLTENATEAVFTFKNTSKEQLNMTEAELMERFTRGDSSRNTEGSGLGLSIAGNLAELQNGSLRLTTDGDLFKATLTFPKI
jgi:signal transduction histidine kinase